MTDLRCPNCGKKLLEYEAEGYIKISIKCRGCKKIVKLSIEEVEMQDGKAETKAGNR